MPIYIKAIILGIVEGLTEFLPVSSTGHLIIVGNLLDFTGLKADTFEIVIQLGAILAVVVLYRDIFWGLFFKQPNRSKPRFSGWFGLWLLFLTTLPAGILGLLTHHYIKAYLFNPLTVALALIGGGFFILGVEKKVKAFRLTSLDQITPLVALGVGCFQCLALWPGFSRAAATILGAMILGMDRKLAAKYSFLAAVPIMVAATGYDLLKSYSLFSAQDFITLGIGFVISFFAAWLAVKTFILWLQKMTLVPFAYYRFLLGLLVLLIFNPF